MNVVAEVVDATARRRGRDALDTAMLTTYGRAPLTAMRVAAEEVSAAPWSSADPPVLGSFAESLR
ncbi:MAG: hypothetical protein JF887_06420 [Candidatus Dormibacteraeota bacterium]|uniref:Uncharacterized protein n=1 Tax=Candidatus Amunia macphersoniae TaxID=3127014 RepID=A0A934NFT9_9BACT|nr:hypothetical protein [Candidatus Dormibacteraeota bacterium]